MSERNVEVVRALLGPFQGINVAEIDWDAEPIRVLLAASLSPEIEVRTLDSGVGTGVDPVYNGVDGVVRYLQDWIAPFGEYFTEWGDFIDHGDFVLIPVRNWGVGSGSGARVEIELVYACEVRDGLITRIHQYDTLEDAERALGSESVEDS
ncbi:MAG TPA: nuclear transport factor 2 family protein [Solirubrobacterales bacterium]|jgi:ketosteroid isomerase-like protein